MDLLEAVGRRHSYRGPFHPAAVPREDLRRMVQAGIQAPSGYSGEWFNRFGSAEREPGAS